MDKQLLNDIKEGALNFWIEHNYAVATGKKDSEEWLDDEYLDEAQWRYEEEDSDDECDEDCVCGNNKHKGLVNGEMRCEDCDIDGINYEGGLTDYEEDDYEEE